MMVYVGKPVQEGLEEVNSKGIIQFSNSKIVDNKEELKELEVIGINNLKDSLIEINDMLLKL
jgi:hypothetical protein